MLGFSQNRSLARSLAALMGFVLAAPMLSFGARAQMAPTGDHYAARASDTGFAGAVNATGGYGASVPLDLPGTRGNLPLPLRVVYGGHRFGAAGLSWDVPLSFIRRESQISHRRQANSPEATPQPRPQHSLMLGGSRTDLLFNDANQTFVARRNGAQLEVRDVGGGVLEMVDGHNLKYVFSSQGGSVGVLDNGNLYLLTDIFGPRGARVHLDYSFGAPSLGGGSTGLSIDLASVSYNYDATGTCAKHIVNLNYGADASSPLSISMLDSTALVRLHKLKESGEGPAIDVTARANSPQPCAGTMKSLRSYNFTYQNDADTGQFQLSQVTQIGQEDTPERNVTLPMATYTYGQVTGSDGKLNYKRIVQQISPSELPSDVDTTFGIARTQALPPSEIPGGSVGTDNFSRQNLIDINGDGRADLVYSNGLGSVSIAVNRPGAGGGSQFTPLGNEPGLGFNQNSQARRVDNVDDSETGSRNRVFRQLIDMNGDGRLDIVAADEVDNAWVVYLNTPNPDNPNETVWVRRLIDIRPILQATGPLNTGNSFTFLPLSQTATVRDRLYNKCWKWTDDNGTKHWVLSMDGYSGGGCNPPQGQDLSRDDFGAINLGEKTITEWELRDINGDGYPDFVYNGSIVAVVFSALDHDPSPPAQPGVFVGQFQETQESTIVDIVGSTDVKALINVAGVHLLEGHDEIVTDPKGEVPDFKRIIDGTSAFSAPITLEVGQPLSSGLQCGVARWVHVAGAGADKTAQICGFEDVNGDGLVDRLTFTQPHLVVARLGTGNLNAPFSGATIQLPGPIARVEADLVATDDRGHFKPAACPDQPEGGRSSFPLPDKTYPIRRTAGLRDINGDGIPDYIVADTSTVNTVWTVAFGTGVGFAAPKTIDDLSAASGEHEFELSLEKVGCFGDNTSAGTSSGLYDIDGDGIPEAVHLGRVLPALIVLKLNTTLDDLGNTVSNPPTSGRLIKIDNGYGAFTNIQYRSAKEDASTSHSVPYPEIVVSSVSTTDASGNLLAQPTLYAYGGAFQFFDAAADRFVFPGYARRVSVQYTGEQAPPTDGRAQISHTYPLATFEQVRDLDATARFLRYAKMGRVSDVTTLSGDIGTDPWALLTTPIDTDARRIAASHYDYSARLLPVVATGNEYCIDMLLPYDYDGSLAYKNDTTHQSFDQCAERGFTLQTSVTSYRGTPGMAVGTANTIPSPLIVQTSAAVNAFDDFGRVTSATQHTDKVGSPNDLCTTTLTGYAQPNTTPVRVLNAPATRTVQDCSGSNVILAKDSFEYDLLDPAQVSDGFVTAHIVTRYDMGTHASLGDIRLFTATYNAAGNVQSVLRVRDEDGANQATFFSYDAFGLVAKSVTSNAQDPTSGFTQFTGSAAYDPVTLDLLSATDPNGTVASNSYDGFGRVTRSKVTPPAAPRACCHRSAITALRQGPRGHARSCRRCSQTRCRRAMSTRRRAALAPPRLTASAAPPKPKRSSVPTTRTRPW